MTRKKHKVEKQEQGTRKTNKRNNTRPRHILPWISLGLLSTFNERTPATIPLFSVHSFPIYIPFIPMFPFPFILLIADERQGKGRGKAGRRTKAQGKKQVQGEGQGQGWNCQRLETVFTMFVFAFKSMGII